MDLTFDQIDQMIRNELDKLTQEDNHIWTAPNYNRRDFVHSFFQYPAMDSSPRRPSSMILIFSSAVNLRRVFRFISRTTFSGPFF